MRNLRYAIFTLSLVASAGCATPPVELFNDRDLSGWEFVTAPAVDIRTVCQVLSEGKISVAGSPIGYIKTIVAYQNYRLHAEYRWTNKPGNSGILVHISSGPKDKAWPLCLQIQTKYKSVGDLLPMAGATFAEPLEPNQKTPQRAHTGTGSEKPVGEWNSCEIICKKDTIEVFINGVVQNKVSAISPSVGCIGFQFEGTPFELRHITMQPLD